MKPCCTPVRKNSLAGNGKHADVFNDSDISECRAKTDSTSVEVPAGEGLVGTGQPQIPIDGEAPLRHESINPFRISPITVTNAAFSEFVASTGYVTEAEKFGWSFVFYSDVPEAVHATQAVVGIQWWRKVDGANWREINGPGTQDADWQPDHPVVQVSWNDAQAYARWAGGRLPSEAEWEHAARGGLGDVRFPWGNDEPNDVDVFPCNIWQGHFPSQNTAADGWTRTAPASSFAANVYGLYNMVGNVWEWTADSFSVNSGNNSHLQSEFETAHGFKLLKGGSFLCHRSYCYRYRIAARIGNSPDSTTSHQGFRVVWDGE